MVEDTTYHAEDKWTVPTTDVLETKRHRTKSVRAYLFMP